MDRRPKARLGLGLTLRAAVALAPGSDAPGTIWCPAFPLAPSKPGAHQEPLSPAPALPSPGERQRDRQHSRPKRELHFLGKLNTLEDLHFLHWDLELQVNPP